MFPRWLVASSCVLFGLPGLCCGGSSSGAPDSLDTACQRIANCPRDDVSSRRDREQQCLDNFSARYDEASGYGCAGAYADVVSCYASAAEVCPATGLIEGCDSAQAAFRACQGRAGKDECVLIANVGGTSGCQIGCALFEATCTTPDAAGQHACSCNTGDQTGATFSVAACDERVEAAARAACQ